MRYDKLWRNGEETRLFRPHSQYEWTGRSVFIHCGMMSHQREHIEGITASRRLQTLSRPRTVKPLGQSGIGRTVAGQEALGGAMPHRRGAVAPGMSPPPPPQPGVTHRAADRHDSRSRGACQKTSIGELAGVRGHDADTGVEQRARKAGARIVFTPGHALAAILLLVAVTCASLTLLVRQSLNYAAANQPYERQTVQTYESQQSELSADGQAKQSQTQRQTDGREGVRPEQSDDASSQVGLSSPQSDGGLINLNTATLEELDSISGIGPVTAQKILDYRQRIGAFSSVEQLLDVSGIGTKTLEKIRARATV